MSIFQPCELLEAMSVTPMCAELYSCFLNGAHAEPVFAEAAEAEGIAESFCSYHKGPAGQRLCRGAASA